MLTAYKKMIPNHEDIKNPIVLIFVNRQIKKERNTHTCMYVCLCMFILWKTKYRTSIVFVKTAPYRLISKINQIGKYKKK